MVVVWDLGVNGRISKRFSFPVEGEGIEIVAASKNCVFVKIDSNGDDSFNVVKCYDANSGRLKQSIIPWHHTLDHHNSTAISNTRKELLSIFAAETPEGDHLTSVRAFCLEVPHL